MRYSEEFKESAVQKYFSRGSRTVSEILEEIGIASTTIFPDTGGQSQLRFYINEFRRS